MPRASANVSLSFGLVNIGISLAPAADEDSGIKGHTVNLQTGNRIAMKVVDSVTGNEVPTAEKGTGYEHGGKVVNFSQGELVALESERDKTIQLTGYVELSEVDPIYFDKTYTAWPQKGNEAGYDLLLNELADTGKALVGNVTLQKSPRLVILRYFEGIIVAHVCLYESRIRRTAIAEIRNAAESRPAPAAEAQAMVGTILAALSEDFDSTAITDAYSERLSAAINAKAGGVVLEQAKDEAVAATPDLMAALKASIEGVKPATKKAPAKRKPKAKV